MANKKVVVIGGGASGFFAAINIAEKIKDTEVVILEKTDKLLSKVRISGGGRCNVTHACFEPKELSQNYPRGERELLGPFHSFSTGDTIEWFDKRGVELKMEEDRRMFPTSDSSQTIIDCFMSEAKRLNIKIKTSTEIIDIKRGERFRISAKKGGHFDADILVIATGGNQKLKHYQMLLDLKHEIVSPIPSLFTFNLPKHKSNSLMGLSVDANVKIVGSKFEEYGPVLFTHWGMSGPAILKLSSKAAKLLYERSYQFEFEVEWMVNADDFIMKSRKDTPRLKLSNTKLAGIPNRLWNYFLSRSKLDVSKNWADLSKAEMTNLAKVLGKDLYYANGKTTFKEEFVSCGGVDLTEINMKTMESKIIPNLFFCGEVMNVDALTGGFNFQAAWTSGYLVAQAVEKKFNRI